ncbi:hypothetical protein AVEN_26154-1 [Araneus ventricosus]|uniref:Uncharacterized protein n=1 Tax=Araneus ventricosus TaxID=182803 RepID=A0A4Y2EQN8_ARAVE|nr:hypothetical protein AVEN_26154-1 [Araneus ventricosus]
MDSTDGIPNSLKPDWNDRMSFRGPRCEGSGRTKVLPTWGPRDEARKSEILSVEAEESGDRRATIAHFGASVYDVRNFST